MANEKVEQAAKVSRWASLKTMFIIAAVLGIEGGTIAVTMFVSGGPAQVSGQGIGSELEAEMNKTVEVKVIADKFPNQMSGRPYLYDTEIWVTTARKNEQHVKDVLEDNNAAISVDIGAIIRRSEPAAFMEPTYATLGRQIKAVLEGRLDSQVSGDQPIVEQVLIRKCIPYRADF
jgi:hypothetical protein